MIPSHPQDPASLPITTIFPVTNLPATKAAFNALYCTQLSSKFSRIPLLREDSGFTLPVMIRVFRIIFFFPKQRSYLSSKTNPNGQQER